MSYTRLPEDPDVVEHLQGYDGQEKATKMRSPTKNGRFRHGLAIFGLLGGLALYFAPIWPSQVVSEQAPSVYDLLNNFTHSPALSTCKPLRAPLPEKGRGLENVWSALTIEEAVKIREFMFHPSQNLNLTNGDKAKMTDNFIELVEAYFPPKAEALAYYNGTGSRPARSARVVITFGGLVNPIVKNFLVSPVPVSSETSFRFLNEIYHRPEIPFEARNINLRDFTEGLPVTKGIQDIAESIFKKHLGGAPGNDSLALAASGPFSFDGSFRRMWMQFKNNVPGSWLNPLDLFFYMDLTGTDRSLWKVLKVVYNKQVFSSQAEFVQAYENKTLKIAEYPEVETNWADRARKGANRDLDHIAGPRSVSFNGLRFRVDEKQQFISWMGWEFHLGFSRDMGMSLWNIKFLGDRIIYELARQEALAQYTGDDPHQASTAWLDRFFGMGASVSEMIPGYDCPHGAVYLPSLVHGADGSVYNPRAICVFEKDAMRPITRHRGFSSTNETGAIKDYVLVVRSVSTVGNYDYIFDYTFMLDGTLEVRVSASGYLQGGFWDPNQRQHGTRINKRSMGTLHDHVINFKVDFDLVNEKNSFMEKAMKVREVDYPWSDDDVWGSTIKQQYIEERYIESEDDSKMFYHQNLQGAYAIVNKDELNTWGVPRGYSILPGPSNVYNTVAGSRRMLNNANFAKQNFAVVQRKETEPSSSAAWNMNLPEAPTVDFDKFFDGDSLVQEDIVAYINVGMHHITQSEDVPNTRSNTATSAFTLSPLNFHDSDVSLASSNAVLMNQDEDTQKWVSTEYGVEEQFCIPESTPKFDYGNDISYGLDGTAEKGGSFRASVARHRMFPHAQNLQI